MSISDILLMRHELVLILAVLILIIVDLNLEKGQSRKFGLWALGLMFIAFVVGLLPQNDGLIFGDMYVTNPMIRTMKNILNLGTLIVFMQSIDSFSKDSSESRSAAFYTLIISSLIGMQYMISSGHFLMFYLGLELATIPLTAVAAFDFFKRNSAEAGIKFLLTAGFSSALLLFGLSYLYLFGGGMYFEDIMSNLSSNPLCFLGFAFMFSGVAFKVSLVPFHLWTADVYEGSPINLTSFLSVVSKGSAIFILIILLYKVFYPMYAIWTEVLYVIIVLTITVGNLFAMRQKNMKRFLAFSSIAQAGFILLGVIGLSVHGFTSVVYFVLIYVFSNLAAFGVASAIEEKTGKEDIADYKGLYKTNPILSVIMMLAMFSLAGIPPVAGFFGKLFLYMAAAGKGYYFLVLIAVLNAIISLYYYLIVVKAMFIDKSETPIPDLKPSFLVKASLIICSLGMVVIGFVGPLFEDLYQLTIQYLQP